MLFQAVIVKLKLFKNMIFSWKGTDSDLNDWKVVQKRSNNIKKHRWRLEFWKGSVAILSVNYSEWRSLYSGFVKEFFCKEVYILTEWRWSVHLFETFTLKLNYSPSMLKNFEKLTGLSDLTFSLFFVSWRLDAKYWSQRFFWLFMTPVILIELINHLIVFIRIVN